MSDQLFAVTHFIETLISMNKITSLLFYGRILTIFPKKLYSSLGPKQKNALALMRWYKENSLLYGPLLVKAQKNINKKISKNDNQIPKKETTLNKFKSLNSDTACIDVVNEKHFQVNITDPVVETRNSAGDTKVKCQSDISQTLELIKSAPLLKGDNDGLSELSELLVNESLPNTPSVSRVLSSTRSAENEMFLERWRHKMIGELGEEGFKKYQEGILRRGTNFHACIQSFLHGTDTADIPLAEDNRGHWDSIQTVLGEVGDVRGTETWACHPYLQYGGKFDCLATYKNSVCLIDWKTSQKQKPFLSYTYDHPLQAAAYMGALNHDPRHSPQVKNALIVIAYGDGAAAHALFMNESTCHKYWTQWLDRLHLYWSRILEHN